MKRMLSISEELSKQLDGYLDGRNFSQFICNLIKENIGIAPQQLRTTTATPEMTKMKKPIEVLKEKLGKTKVEFCPHMIATTGYCRKCNE